MKAIIVAGGRGERLRPLTDFIPKPMVEVAGKPILLHTVELLKSAGITEFIFALCYLPKVVKEYFGNGSKFGISIEYTIEDPLQPLGTAGAIKASEVYISETFIVTYADIVRELDVKTMVSQHKETGALGTLNVYKRYGKEPKSKVLFDNNYKIEQFVERPERENIESQDFVWCNGSFYIFEPEIFTHIPSHNKADFGKDIFPMLVESKKALYSYPTQGMFIDVGTKEKHTQAEELLKSS